MPKGDNQVNLRANLDFKRMLISMHKTKVVETIMVMKKKMVKLMRKMVMKMAMNMMTKIMMMTTRKRMTTMMMMMKKKMKVKN